MKSEIGNRPKAVGGMGRKLRAQLHALDTLGPYLATCKNFRIREAPAYLVSQYLLTLEGKKQFVEMVGKYS